MLLLNFTSYGTFKTLTSPLISVSGNIIVIFANLDANWLGHRSCWLVAVHQSAWYLSTLSSLTASQQDGDTCLDATHAVQSAVFTLLMSGATIILKNTVHVQPPRLKWSLWQEWSLASSTIKSPAFIHFSEVNVQKNNYKKQYNSVFLMFFNHFFQLNPELVVLMPYFWLI